jgi:hypothetical protein
VNEETRRQLAWRIDLLASTTENSIDMVAADPCDEFLGTPSQELRSAAWRVRDVALRSDAGSAVAQLRLAWQTCRDDLCRALGSDALSPAVESLAVACRTNPSAYNTLAALGQQIAAAAEAAWDTLRAAHYCPLSPGATAGEQWALSEADVADVDQYVGFASRAMFQLVVDGGSTFDERFFATSRAPSETALRVAVSALEAALFGYLRQRLPAMFYRGECDDESPSDQIKSGLERKNKLFAQLLQAVKQRCEALLNIQHSDAKARTDPARGFALSAMCDFWGAVHVSLANYANLQLFTEMHQTPKRTQRQTPASPWPYPLVNLRSVYIARERRIGDADVVFASSVDRYCSLTHVTVGRAWGIRRPRNGDRLESIRALLCQPQLGGPSSLSRNSYIPLNRLTHPEDPLVLFGQSIACDSDELLRSLAEVFDDLELSSENLDALGQLPRVQLVTRRATRRRLAGLGAPVPTYASYLLMARQDAATLGLRDTRSLPASELRALAAAAAPVDEDVQMVWWDWGDDDDSGGDDDPLPPPPDSPARQRALPPEPIPETAGTR